VCVLCVVRACARRCRTWSVYGRQERRGQLLYVAASRAGMDSQHAPDKERHRQRQPYRYQGAQAQADPVQEFRESGAAIGAQQEICNVLAL